MRNNKRSKETSAFHLFTRQSKLFLIATILLFNSTVFAQEEESKTKFIDKIGHWFVAYGMSSPDPCWRELVARVHKERRNEI